MRPDLIRRLIGVITAVLLTVMGVMVLPAAADDGPADPATVATTGDASPPATGGEGDGAAPADDTTGTPDAADPSGTDGGGTGSGDSTAGDPPAGDPGSDTTGDGAGSSDPDGDDAAPDETGGSAVLPGEDEADEDGRTTNAVLRWGMNNEANNRSAEGSFNFLSAGRIAKPINAILDQGGWSRASGDVRIEKWDGSKYVPATWAGLSVDSTGAEILHYLSGRYSNHQFVFSNGVGTVDREAGTAHIEWKGDVSAIFYGGMVFFYLSDPVLDVADGKGTLTGTVSGYGSSIERPDISFPVAPRQVTLAEFSGARVSDTGFSVTPAYDGVTTLAEGRKVTGSFPQSFVTAMELFGTASFWYDSGSSLDPAKRPLPITVSYRADKPVTVVPPPISKPRPPVSNQIKKAPTLPAPALTPAPLAVAPLALTPPTAVAPPPLAATAAGFTGEAIATADPVMLVASHASAQPQHTGAVGWWLGGSLFGLAGVVLAGSLLAPSQTSRRKA